MQKLKTLRHELLTENVFKSLNQNRISSILDFLQEDIEKLSTITKLSLPQILNIRNDIFKIHSTPLVNGTTLLFQNVLKRKFISTGMESLNTLMGGGIPIGCITEVYGLADSGKTQLCHQLTINCVRNTEDTVLYIDTKGDFSAVKIQKILDSCGCSHKEMAVIMYKIRVIQIWTMDELLELFKKLKHNLIVIENLSIIIIDSLPCLMFQYLGEDNKVGLTFLNMLVNYSRFLCKELDIGIVCVNIQTRWVDQDISDLEDDAEHPISTFKGTAYVEKRNRCLGKYWQHIPALVLLIKKNEENANKDNIYSSKVDIKVLKSSYLDNVGITCTLKLTSLGVTD